MFNCFFLVSLFTPILTKILPMILIKKFIKIYLNHIHLTTKDGKLQIELDANHFDYEKYKILAITLNCIQVSTTR